MTRIIDYVTVVGAEQRFRDLSNVNYLVLHHTAGSSTQLPEDVKYRDPYSGKVYKAPYHYLVYLDGRIYKVRPVSSSGVCVANANSRVICVAGVGNWENADITTPQFVEAVAQLCAVLLIRYPRLEIVLHKYLVQTDCPGRYFPFRQIMSRVENYRSFYDMLGRD